MAQRIKGITIEIGGDTTKLDKALAGVNKEIRTTSTNLKDVERLLKLDPTNTELLAQKQRLLADEVVFTKDKLDKLKVAAESANEALKAGDITQAQYDAIQREIIETEEAYKAAKKAAEDFNITAEKIKAVGASFQEAGEKITAVGDKIAGAGKSLSVVSAGVAAVGAAAIKTTSEFEASMSNVAAVIGWSNEQLADSSSEAAQQFELLKEKAKEMGATTKFTAAESAEAMNYMAMAGWKAEEMLNGIDGIMNLAAASGEDLGRVSDIVTDALTAFGMAAGDAGHFADVLAKAASNANTNVGMMGESFKYVAPVAGSLGYSIEDTAVALGLMANSGIKASMAGTSLRSFLTRLANPSDAVAASMDRLGISLEDENGQLLSLMDLMKQLRESFSGGSMPVEEFTQRVTDLDQALEDGSMSQDEYDLAMNALASDMYGVEGAQKAMEASILGGQRGMAGLLAIVNTSDEDFQSLTDSIYAADGAAKQMADVQLNNLEGQMTILKSELEGLQISFGELLVPVLREVVEWLQGAVTWVHGLDDDTKKMILTVAAVVAALGPALLIIGNVISAVGTITSALGGLITFIASPAGIIAAIAAAVAALVVLYNTNEDFRNSLASFDEWLTNVFTHDWTEDFGILGEIVNGFFASANDIFTGLKLTFGGIIDFITGVFTLDWEKAWQGLVNALAGIFGTLAAVLSTPLNVVLGMVNSLVALVVSGINAVIEALNTISFDVPDWVPGLGGKHFGFDIGTISAPSLPYLTFGDELVKAADTSGGAGTSAEAPAMSRREAALTGGTTKVEVKFSGNLAQLGRVLAPEIAIVEGDAGGRMTQGGGR